MTKRHLITVDELRAAGALDVPPEWRKSLSARLERNLFSGLFKEEHFLPEPESNDDSLDDAELLDDVADAESD